MVAIRIVPAQEPKGGIFKVIDRIPLWVRGPVAFGTSGITVLTPILPLFATPAPKEIRAELDKNDPLFETPKAMADSLKTQILKADEKGRLEIGNGQIIYAEPNSKIIKVPPKTEAKIEEPKQTDDLTYGIQPKTADAYLSTGTGVVRVLNGQIAEENYNMGQPVTYPAYRNGIQVYQPVTFTFQAHFENYPPYSAIKENKYRFYYLINVPPIDTNNCDPTIQILRNFLQNQGEPLRIYNALMFFSLARGPPLYQIPTKYAILASWETDSTGGITNTRGPPTLWCIGACDAYLTSGDARTAIGTVKPNSLISGSGNDLTFGYIAGVMGALDNWLNESYTCLLITEITVVNTISTQVPDKFSLSQNYPNPFNANTAIKYEILKTGFVKLTVYNILGKEVTNLVNETLKPGEYKAIFDAANLPSGVYYYRLNVNEFTETKKMMLVK